MSLYLRIAALVVFVIAALAAWLTDTDFETVLGLIAVGLACMTASELPPRSP